MYEPPDEADLERGRDHHRQQLAREAKELADARHDHREGVECPKCVLLERERQGLRTNPNMPACPTCGHSDEVSREGSRFFCERCDLAFTPKPEAPW